MSADDKRFEELARLSEKSADLDSGERTPSRLKAKIYSKLIRKQQEKNPLRVLQETKDDGGKLCVFEEIARIAPLHGKWRTRQHCEVCHARVLAEFVEGAPIYWPGCPYVEFQNR